MHGPQTTLYAPCFHRSHFGRKTLDLELDRTNRLGALRQRVIEKNIEVQINRRFKPRKLSGQLDPC